MGCFFGPTFGDLTICADNCAGGGKEQDYYLLYSMDSIYSSIILVTLFRKHKECYIFPSDLLKCGYHQRNIFTYEELLKVLDRNHQV